MEAVEICGNVVEICGNLWKCCGKSVEMLWKICGNVVEVVEIVREKMYKSSVGNVWNIAPTELNY